MPLTKLGLSTIIHLKNGAIEVAFARELESVINDLKDRPHIATEREVTLTLKIKPADIDGGILETVSTKLQVGSKIPIRRTTGLSMRVVGGNADQLEFNVDSPDAVNQQTFDLDDDTDDTDGA